MNEWLSTCCTVESLYNLEILEEMDTIGICSNCREHTSFEQRDEMPIPNHCIDCDKPSILTLNGTPYCVKHWKNAKEKENEQISK